MIGAGLVGLSCAWLLARRGHRVLLLEAGEPCRFPLPPAGRLERGSEAALGVLMGHVFHRSSGRAWRLRQRSMDLWSAWRAELAVRGRLIGWRPGLLLLAAGAEDLQRQRALLLDPRRQRAGLQGWDRARLEALVPAVPAAALAGLYSPQDGQLDPHSALAALAEDGAEAGLQTRSDRAEALEPIACGWRVRLPGGDSLESEWLVLAAGLGCAPLLAAAGQPAAVRLEPVLGQALELELDAADLPQTQLWPGVLVWRGLNLILLPPAAGHAAAWRLWLGATLEPGQQASAAEWQALRGLVGEAPDWLRRASVRRQWQGLRARPVGQPAPLLQELAPGLLLAAGHYRNGVLLAPASAEWVCGRIEAGHGTT